MLSRWYVHCDTAYEPRWSRDGVHEAMAYLNVRERRIEAKIAYVGPQLSGKGTNFEQLKQSNRDARVGKFEESPSDDSDVLSFAWQPPASDRFRDCDVLVKVVASRSSQEPEAFDRMLSDVDGVVLVMDAHPAAQARNRESLAQVRHAIADRHVPVVLQINKADLPEAMATREVLGGLGAETVPHVSAVATRGDGVVETLEMAMNEVLSSMRSERAGADVALDPAKLGNVARGGGSGGANEHDGAHPLLAALRQVLRDTVSEHVDQVAARVTERIEASLARLDQRMRDSEAAVVAIRERLDGIAERSTNDSHDGWFEAVALLRNAEASLQKTATALANPTGEPGSSLTARLDALRDEIKADVARSIEVRARADREHVTGATATLKKALDAVATDLKSFDVRGRVGEVAEVVSAVAARGDDLSSRVDKAETSVRSVESKLDAADASMQRVAKVEETLRGLRSDLGTAFGAVNEKTDALQLRMNEIVEELKKPKKGWFA